MFGLHPGPFCFRCCKHLVKAVCSRTIVARVNKLHLVKIDWWLEKFAHLVLCFVPRRTNQHHLKVVSRGRSVWQACAWTPSTLCNSFPLCCSNHCRLAYNRGALAFRVGKAGYEHQFDLCYLLSRLLEILCFSICIFLKVLIGPSSSGHLEYSYHV